MRKGIIAERKARDKERRTRSVNHLGTSMNAKPIPKNQLRVQSVDQVNPIKKRPPPVKRPSRKAKSAPLKKTRPVKTEKLQKKDSKNSNNSPFLAPSPQTHPSRSPDRNHPPGSMFRRLTSKDKLPFRKGTGIFPRMSRRFVWAEEPSPPDPRR